MSPPRGPGKLRTNFLDPAADQKRIHNSRADEEMEAKPPGVNLSMQEEDLNLDHHHCHFINNPRSQTSHQISELKTIIVSDASMLIYSFKKLISLRTLNHKRSGWTLPKF